MGSRKLYNVDNIKITCVACEHLKEEVSGVYCYKRPESKGTKIRVRAYNNYDICPSISLNPKHQKLVADSIIKQLNIMIRKYKERNEDNG
jgi:hypothetical protein